MPGQGRFCNVGDAIYVNLPRNLGANNHAGVKLWAEAIDPGMNEPTFNLFHCCDSRAGVDLAVDKLAYGYSDHFKKPWDRDVRCLIKGYTLCEQCGASCQSCGAKC